MAIEIIGEDESMKIDATCDNCGSVLRFYPVDAEKKTLHHFDESTLYWCVKCPKCGNEVLEEL